MIKPGKYWSLASLALLRLSESDLRALHSIVSEMSPGSFVELVRDIEDEIDNSLALTVNRSMDHSFFSSNMHDIYHDLDQMRKKELRIPVQMFADMLAENLLKLSPKNANRVPLFDSRRGLQAWITKLVTIFSVQEVFHAAMRIKHEHEKTTKSDWRLR